MSGPIARVRRKPQENRPGWGFREDGTPKGEGWLGLLQRPDGNLSTELSAGVQIGGKEVSIPLIVPTLTAEEVKWLLAKNPQAKDFFKTLPPSIMNKAIDHAMRRLNVGKTVRGLIMSEDFLDVSDARETQRTQALEYAKLYVATFVNSPSGAQLLREWDERCVRKQVPVNAPHTEYAAVEAVRQFVNGIHLQIKLAQTEGR